MAEAEPEAHPKESILDTTKKMLGLGVDYDAFDVDIITHINSVFFTLQQLGVGPPEGYTIEDSTKQWPWFTGATNINAVKSYMYLKVRLLFDPPNTSYALDSMTKMALEYEWRLNVKMEGERHNANVS